MREELHQMYRELYHAYCMLNRICWGRTLPRCVLAVSGTQRHSWAYASPRCAAGCPLIAVNSTACGQIGNDRFLGILAHEMIHVRQFAQDRRGDFNRQEQIDFYLENQANLFQ